MAITVNRGATIVVGAAVANGTDGRIFYQVASNTVGQMTTTGSGTVVVLATSPTLAGTVTLPDASTVASTGIANVGSFTTVSTPSINYAPTWNYSSTGNALAVIVLSPTLVPTGASAGTIFGVSLTTHIGTSSVNGSTFTGTNNNLTVDAGYAGTFSGGLNGITSTVINSGTNAAPIVKSFSANISANGNGTTTATVVNHGFFTNSGTAAAASGGTVTNNSATLSLSTGSGAGTTTNRGLYITGNGGSGGGGTTTNYAIFSDSTAASSLAGQLTVSSGTAPPAAGAATAGILMSSTASLGLYFGSNVPTFAAAQGSVFMRTDGSTIATRLYVNTNGSTGWTNFVSGA